MINFATMKTIHTNPLLHILAAAVLLLASSTTIQAAKRHTVKKQQPVDSMAWVNRYVDTLSVIRDSIFSQSLPATQPDDRLYQLFVPLTFYHAPITNQLSLDKADTTLLADNVDDMEAQVERTLFHIYLNRPELVKGNETQLRKSGTLIKPQKKQLKQELELTEHTALLPAEPTVAPQGLVIKKPNFWSFSGDQNLQFLQNYVTDNWYKGGESNYSMVGSVTLNANYNNKQKVKFENKLELKLGFQTSRGDTVHKYKTNEDLIRYTGKLGLQAANQWYYTVQLLAYTQFTQGLKSNDHYVYSDFMSPFNLNFGLGMDYSVKTKNNRLSGSVNLSVLSFNFRYVDRKNLASRYSIRGNNRTREDFGSQITADLRWNISDQVNWRTRFYTYTTYESVLMEWENTISLRVSKYISANIFLYPRFDDSAKRDEKLDYFQFKEYSSLGFSYNF